MAASAIGLVGLSLLALNATLDRLIVAEQRINELGPHADGCRWLIEGDARKCIEWSMRVEDGRAHEQTHTPGG
jgi:hypothetical protein